MEETKNAVELAMEQFKAEFGQDAKLEDGEEFATVFNDAVVIIGLNNRKLSVRILAGKPYLVNQNLNLTE
ncbi:hypothetical protein IX307_001396 [Bacteroides pyogenes]|uniref:Uncharacterized protein n=1 Tax=Bacteroides pyogenes F0041 TaxID=1321819 RepID=U2DIY3_9BACE|nr:hypothetical protein [Bacteroides pyogenes]ERI81457.1 hypothetical protein HMPREF1981_03221 [Bacteroides pyogenes F0041]MBR8720180.1 hypothetical protein [Bacteroides pyogenes]MBR8787075.1 hypothetical protein [Bacteroides pyogenes]MBR8792557.1 hypothetical protein [Bacteroides pyogenes]MCE9106584.1 hypothetical protein [Bacteroides pyogenes]